MQGWCFVFLELLDAFRMISLLHGGLQKAHGLIINILLLPLCCVFHDGASWLQKGV